MPVDPLARKSMLQEMSYCARRSNWSASETFSPPDRGNVNY